MTQDPRFAVPPSTRPILPGLSRRVVFAALGVAAAVLRALSLPWRRRWSRKAAARNRILVLEPFGMGDVVALQPLVRAWCEAGREVVVGTRPAWHPLLVPHPNLTCVDCTPSWASPDPARKYRGLWRGPGSVPSVVRSLRAWAKGARGIDVRGDVRSILLLYAAGCGSVETLSRYFTATDCRVFPLAARRQPVDRTVERWRLNGVFAENEGLALSPPSMRHLLDFLPASGGERTCSRRIGLVPLTPWVGKQWLPDAWGRVARDLRARGFSPVLLHGPGEGPLAAAATGTNPDLAPLPREEAHGVQDWVYNISCCDAIICVNTGPMHLAAALEIPVVVVEGCSRLPLWAPASPLARVVHHQEEVACAPCHPSADTEACARRCMALVRPEEVLAALESLSPAVR